MNNLLVTQPEVSTYSGKLLDLHSPSTKDIDYTDIAWALGRTPRYNGHTHVDWTVAHHSVVLAHADPTLGLHMLLHDAAEAYIGDIVAPVKDLAPQIKEVEEGIWRAIYKKIAEDLGIDFGDIFPVAPTRQAICQLDIDMLQHECYVMNAPSHCAPYPPLFNPVIQSAWEDAVACAQRYWAAPALVWLMTFYQLTELWPEGLTKGATYEELITFMEPTWYAPRHVEYEELLQEANEEVMPTPDEIDGALEELGNEDT